MIVDLMRNDLGRVCEYGSIRVPALTEPRPAPGVWHLVSTVHGHAPTRRRRRRPAARELPARLGDRRAEDPGDARDRRARGRRPRGVHGRARLREPGGGARAERGDPDARDARRAHLDGRGRRDRGRLRGRARARGVLREGAAGDRGGGRAADRGAAREPRRRRSRALAGGADRPDPALGVFETLLVRGGVARGRPRAPRPARAQRERAVRRGAAGGPARAVVAAAAAAPLARLRVPLGRARRAARRAGRARRRSRSRREPAPEPVTLSPAVLPGGLGAHKWRDRRLLDELGRPARGRAAAPRPRRRRARGRVRQPVHRRGRRTWSLRRSTAASCRAPSARGCSRCIPRARSGCRSTAWPPPTRCCSRHRSAGSTRHGSPMAQSRTSSSARACGRPCARTLGASDAPDDARRLLRPRARRRRGQRRAEPARAARSGSCAAASAAPGSAPG